MKHLIIISFFMLAGLSNSAQNVGIGTANPLKKLSVNGSLMVDQNGNNNGTLDSAAIMIGGPGNVGISSNRDNTQPNVNGLDFWTNRLKRFCINSSGNVGIGTTDPLYKLDVNGSIRSIYLYTSTLDVNGFTYMDNLTVYDDARVMGNVGVGEYAQNRFFLK